MEKLGKQQCGYRAASEGDGLDMEEEGYSLQEIE